MYYILNSNFQIIMALERYISFLWTDRYFEAGEFEIEAIPTNELLDACQQGYYIINTNSEHEMIIEGVKITTNAEDGARLYVTGRSLESILNRRIVWNKTVLDGNLQNGIKTLLTQNIISPSIADRKISNFVFQASIDSMVTSLSLHRECDKENLYDLVVDICKTKGLGFKITRNATNQFVFSLYAGADYTYEQKTNPYVVFSSKFDNLEESEYNNSITDFVNTVYVTGGENDSETLVVGSYNGLARRESYVNAGTMDEEYSGSYADFLKEKANEELENKKMVKTFEGDVDPQGLFKLNIDFTLGDIVQLENEFGIKDQTRIIEIIYATDESGDIVYPTFEAYEKPKDGGGSSSITKTITQQINVSNTLRYSSDWLSNYNWAKVSAYSSGSRYNCFGMSGSTYNSALIQIPDFSFSGTGEKLTCSFYGYYNESHSFRWALATDISNRNMYKGMGAVTGDGSQIASGTFTLGASTSQGYRTYSFEIPAKIPSNTPLYLYLWAYESGNRAVHIMTDKSFSVTLSYKTSTT